VSSVPVGAGGAEAPGGGAAGAGAHAPRPETWKGFYEYEAGVYSITPETEPAFRHRRELVMRLLRRDVGLQGRVLDVGCGDGALCEALRERSRRGGHPAPWICGTDLAARRVERARGRVPWLPVL